VRGYGADALLGRSAAAASVELRLPLALVGRGLGLLPVYLDRMSLSLFADAGAAWFPKGFTTQLPSSSTIGGVGAELVTDLGAVYATPLRLRAGVARAPHAGAPLVLYVAFGPSF
jgi:hemolysin activation/secretion protein